MLANNTCIHQYIDDMQQFIVKSIVNKTILNNEIANRTVYYVILHQFVLHHIVSEHLYVEHALFAVEASIVTEVPLEPRWSCARLSTN